MKNATLSQVAKAFTKWEKEYRKDPDAFWSEGRKLLRETPKTYGDACAPYFLKLLGKVQARRA